MILITGRAVLRCHVPLHLQHTVGALRNNLIKFRALESLKGRETCTLDDVAGESNAIYCKEEHDSQCNI
jgi:hypothetical protein